MIPEDAWLWAGTNWRKDISTSLVDCLTGVILQSDDPDYLCSKWEKALGKTKSSNEVAIELNSSKISFLKSTDGRGEGINAFVIKTSNKDEVFKRADEMNLLTKDEIMLGGVKMILKD
jgi:hypothetical protein